MAFCMMFRNSSVSIKSLGNQRISRAITHEFQIILLSLMPTWSYDLYTSSIFLTPSSSDSCVLQCQLVRKSRPT